MRKIKDAIPISERPPEVEDRAVPGHWPLGDADNSGEWDIIETINGSHIVGVSDFLRGDGTTGAVGEVFLISEHLAA